MEAIFIVLGTIICSFGFAIGCLIIYFERLSFSYNDKKRSSEKDLRRMRKNTIKGYAIAIFFGVLILLIINP